MKSKKGLFLFAVTLLILSCAKDPGANEPVEDHLIFFKWKIDYFNLDGLDQTSAFGGYVFDFSDTDSLIRAEKGSDGFDGKWYRSNSSFDNPKIVITFQSNATLMMLNREWQQTHRAADTIRFQNTQNNGYVLLFVKN
jgi:hypothetical protein